MTSSLCSSLPTRRASAYHTHRWRHGQLEARLMNPSSSTVWDQSCWALDFCISSPPKHSADGLTTSHSCSLLVPNVWHAFCSLSAFKYFYVTLHLALFYLCVLLFFPASKLWKSPLAEGLLNMQFHFLFISPLFAVLHSNLFLMFLMEVSQLDGTTSVSLEPRA